MWCKYCHCELVKYGNHYRAAQPGFMGFFYHCPESFKAEQKTTRRMKEVRAAPHQPMNNLELLEYMHVNKKS